MTDWTRHVSGEPYTAKGMTAASRIKAHAAFDPLWQSGQMTRSEAYRWLADELGVPKRLCHMKHFDDAICRKVVRICTLRQSKSMAGGNGLQTAESVEKSA